MFTTLPTMTAMSCSAPVTTKTAMPPVNLSVMTIIAHQFTATPSAPRSSRPRRFDDPTCPRVRRVVPYDS